MSANDLYARLRLALWFQLLAIWSIFSPRIGKKVLGAYINDENKKADEINE